MILYNNHTRFFRISGFVIPDTTLGGFPTLLIEQEDRYRVDLLTRLNELVLNWGADVSCRFWIGNAPITEEIAMNVVAAQAGGYLDVEFEAQEYSYSEYSRGIDYNSNFSIGGHDLFAQMKSANYVMIDFVFSKNVTWNNIDYAEGDADE